VTHAHVVTWSVIRGRAAVVMVDVRLRAEGTGPARVVVKITHLLGIEPDDVAKPGPGMGPAQLSLWLSGLAACTSFAFQGFMGTKQLKKVRTFPADGDLSQCL
jgi:hypothetical protein